MRWADLMIDMGWIVMGSTFELDCNITWQISEFFSFFQRLHIGPIACPDLLKINILPY